MQIIPVESNSTGRNPKKPSREAPSESSVDADYSHLTPMRVKLRTSIGAIEQYCCPSWKAAAFRSTMVPCHSSGDVACLLKVLAPKHLVEESVISVAQHHSPEDAGISFFGRAT
jgi:hypothetical protein